MRKIEKRRGIIEMLKEFEKDGVELTDDLLTVDLNFPKFINEEGKLVGIGFPNGGDKYFVESSFGDLYSEDKKYYYRVGRCLLLSTKKFLNELIPGENFNTIGKFDSTKKLSYITERYEGELSRLISSDIDGSLECSIHKIQELSNELVEFVCRYINLINWGGDNVKVENVPIDVATFFLDLKDISTHIDLRLSSSHSILSRLNFNFTEKEKEIRSMSKEHVDDKKLLHKAIMEFSSRKSLKDKYGSSLEALDIISDYLKNRDDIGKLGETIYKGTFNVILSLIGDIYTRELVSDFFKKVLSTSVNKYVKKPIEVEAIQLSKDNQEEVHNFAGKSLTFNKYGAVVHTLEGEMSCEFGDYIIKGVKGEFYPCKKEIFEETYN
jgi:hypothetical protein